MGSSSQARRRNTSRAAGDQTDREAMVDRSGRGGVRPNQKWRAHRGYRRDVQRIGRVNLAVYLDA
jgi:hypothetical protein